MTGNDVSPTQNSITLGNNLTDMRQLPPWVEALASHYGINASLQFAIELCLEEAVSNVIRHGFGQKAGMSLVVRFDKSQPGRFFFVVEDDAQHFNPLEAPEPLPLDEDLETRVGGRGIRLLREFADTLEYETMPNGNRLRIGFLIEGGNSSSK
jgi:anti-sigma regulatory factor (Ser/Thr protein kinase)